MTTKKSRFIYWDSCVFLAYIRKEPERIDTINSLWHEIVENEGDKIITSSLSIVEVTHVASEKLRKKLDLQVEQAIDDLWKDKSIIMVEFSPSIAFIARKLQRDALVQNLSLKPYDSVHLATAKWMVESGYSISEFHTYDLKLLAKYTGMLGIDICEPNTTKPSFGF